MKSLESLLFQTVFYVSCMFYVVVDMASYLWLIVCAHTQCLNQTNKQLPIHMTSLSLLAGSMTALKYSAYSSEV